MSDVVMSFDNVHVETDYTIPMTRIESRLLSSVRENHRKGGRPNTWPALKRTGKPSHLTRTGRMALGHTSSSGADFAQVNAAVWPGMFIHQFSGWAGRNHMSFIPARPYIVLQEEDKTYAIEQIGDAIFEVTPIDLEKQAANTALRGK